MSKHEMDCAALERELEWHFDIAPELDKQERRDIEVKAQRLLKRYNQLEDANV